jgi:hypothetical protein
MSGKSRRRGRHLPRSKRKKGRKGFSAPVASAPAEAQKPEPAPRADTVIPSPKTPTPKAAVAQATNVAAELRRIGILAGIILVILVVLFFVLS